MQDSCAGLLVVEGQVGCKRNEQQWENGSEERCQWAGFTAGHGGHRLLDLGSSIATLHADYEDHR